MANRNSGRSSNQLSRSLAALTIGVQQSVSRRQQASASEAAGDLHQQVQLPLDGKAALAVAFLDHAINWRLPFVYAPQQRLTQFKVPQFSYGVEFKAIPAELVVIHASVLQWTKDARNWLVGATIRIVTQAPTVDNLTNVPYNAVAHLIFQGYAAQPEDTGV